MANEPVERSGSLLQAVTRMVEAAANDGTGYDSLVPVLSLICLVSILGHGQPRAVQAAPATGAGSLQKLLGDLTKGDGGGLGPEALVSILPLLNSPQVKSKLNPATIAAIMGLLNNMGDKGDKSETVKQEPAKQSGDKSEKMEEKKPIPPTAATVTSLEALAERQETLEPSEGDKKGLGRYLNWKSNF
jgi:hypothetical protein